MNGLASTKLARKPHCDLFCLRTPWQSQLRFFQCLNLVTACLRIASNSCLETDKVTKVDSEQWAQSVTGLLHSATVSHVSNMKKINCQQIPNNHSATECFVSCKVVQEAKQQHNMKPLDFSTAACGQNHHLKDSKTNENTWLDAYGGITNSYVRSQFLISRSLGEYPCHVSQHPLICPGFNFYLSDSERNSVALDLKVLLSNASTFQQPSVAHRTEPAENHSLSSDVE